MPRAVAAGAELAGGAERAVDQAAVEVAQFEAELALAEEPVFRIRRLVVGEVEDADIDGRDRDIGVGGRRQRRSPRPGSTAAGAACVLSGGVERDGELLVARIDLQPFHADGAGRHARSPCASPGRKSVAVT